MTTAPRHLCAARSHAQPLQIFQSRVEARPEIWPNPLLQADEKHKREKFVLSVAYSPDGKRLACGVMDGTVALFDVPSGQLMHTLTGHHKPVRDVCFTPGWYKFPSLLSISWSCCFVPETDGFISVFRLV